MYIACLMVANHVALGSSPAKLCRLPEAGENEQLDVTLVDDEHAVWSQIVTTRCRSDA